MKNISFMLDRKVSQQVEREVDTLKRTLRRDKIEFVLGHLTPTERFEYACRVFELDEVMELKW
ncbi:MAG: hypothetical protein EFT35_05275 [Methanophagales archaeon ANME-1-THS]|nr:MAG: hypothetical protein EFT35_05275 [Methanophagales archaeon ANME-1-THS]